jgi:hypothetical protein
MSAEKVLTEAGVMERLRLMLLVMRARGLHNLARYRASQDARRIHQDMFAEENKDRFWVEVDPESVEATRAHERGWALEE